MAQTPHWRLPRVASRAEWLRERKRLLAQEKELTRAVDQLNADRRRLPMVRIDKSYTFDGPNGSTTLLDLFDGRRQLIVDHFMWAYDVDDNGVEHPRDVGCPSCSATADDIGNLIPLHVRNTSLVAISRAPFDKINRFRERMGWKFPWCSSANSEFNYDFHATVDERVAPVLVNFRDQSELDEHGTSWASTMRGDYPGVSAFLREADTIYHTYSTYARGLEFAGTMRYYLDLTALGRLESWEEPRGRADALGLQAGGPEMRFRDEYASE